ncbi:MAG: (2Fe-2S)-binding protein [Armatimonadota bacterium]|nr:MAG: (2Fe-2S)-binding protein [Armatimonadota bacterium]
MRVNGIERRLHTPGSRSLLSVLRDDLALTGAKYGCGKGHCGACTVLVDDQAVRSCTLPLALAHGRSVTTIEGLAPSGGLHPVQQAFLDAQAFQCGYCTPGFIMGVIALLKTTSNPTELEIREGLAGHLCRCGSYPRIIRAVQLAAARMRE